jgi:glycine cleavage system H protein
MIPENLKYAKTHEWAKTEADGTITVGITFHAQEQLGDVVFVQHPDVERKVSQGEACAVIESVKAASDIHAPVSGEILTVNPELANAPELVNRDPYEAWMFRIKPDAPTELDALLDFAAYRKFAESE